MIASSTPGSITYQSNDGREVIFYGEWTLEPKFYISVPESAFWNSTKETKLTEQELDECINGLLNDAINKGWEIVVE